jgi:hypothetical protein
MNTRTILITAIAGIGCFAGASAIAQTIYLNKDNITVTVGSGTSPGSFNNTFDNGATIEKVIDAPSATASEFHNQQTHIWFTASSIGGGLELDFDLQTSYDISTLHFWNYDGEDFDVDNVAFSFFDSANQQVGSLGISPALGSSPAIFAQDIALAAPLNVRYVTAFLTGSNRQVDFQNIGFTATVSVVPEPAALVTLPLGLAIVSLAIRRRQTQVARSA